MKNNYFLEDLTLIANAISSQFGNNCEVAIFDLKDENPENTLYYIVNGKVTGRKHGDSPSKIVLESMEKIKDGQELANRFSYRTKTSDGRILKSSTVFLKDEDGNDRYMMAINYDITGLLYMEENISQLTKIESVNGSPSEEISIPGTVGDLLDDLLKQSAKLIGKEPTLMTKEEKIKAIRYLNDAGAFLIMKSGDRIAEFFGLSKYTLYSYAEINKPH